MKKIKRLKIKQRNSFACHPIMKKGGIHQKTGKAKRRTQKVKDRSLFYL